MCPKSENRRGAGWTSRCYVEAALKLSFALGPGNRYESGTGRRSQSYGYKCALISTLYPMRVGFFHMG
jgi:hypothetical protein